MLEVLTQSEIELAEKLIGKLEKRARDWVSARWVMLIAGIVCLGAFCFLTASISGKLSKLYSPVFLAAEGSRPGVDNIRMSLQITNRINLVHTIMMDYISSLIMFFFGVILVMMALVKWRRHLHLGLIAKLLRAKLETERSALAGGASGNTET